MVKEMLPILDGREYVKIKKPKGGIFGSKKHINLYLNPYKTWQLLVKRKLKNIFDICIAIEPKIKNVLLKT